MATVTTTRHPVALSLLQGKEQGGGIAGAALTLIFRDLRLQSYGRKAKSHSQTSGHSNVRDTSRCERAVRVFTLSRLPTSFTPDGLLLRVPFTKVGVWFVSQTVGVWNNENIRRIPHLTLAGDCPPAGPPCPSHLNGQPTVGQDKEPDPLCPLCGGSGVCDSGGTTPWGEGINVRCSCTYVNPQGAA